MEIENSGFPVTEKLNFSFVRDSRLRAILERDWDEAQRAYIAQCWKSVVILTGGALEAVLLDRALQDELQVIATKSAPKNKELNKWELSELIKAAIELKLVTPVVQTLGDTVRQYRNLVHPGVEVRTKLSLEKLEADSGLTVLRTVCRDLDQIPVDSENK